MNNSLYDLFRKIISDEITPGEIKQLKSAVSEMSDSQLGRILSDVWEEYEGAELEYSDFESIVRLLRPVRRKSNLLFVKIFAGAAAALILILGSAYIWQYSRNDRLQEFIGRNTYVNVASGEKADITLPDSSRVHLNFASTMSYTLSYGLAARELHISGEAFIDVVKGESTFSVNTGTVKIDVLGTKFNVNSYPDSDISEVTLIEGSLKLTTIEDDPKSVMLSPYQKAIYNKESGMLSVVETSGRFETAWTRGELVFRSAKFIDIIKQIERRYGVEIEVKGKPHGSDLFTGNFKDEHISGVLKILKLHYNFSYIVKGDKVYINFI